MSLVQFSFYSKLNAFSLLNLNTLGEIFLPSWALRAPFHEKICILFGTCAKQVTNMYLTVRYTRIVLVRQQSKPNAFSLVYQRMPKISFGLVQFSLTETKLNVIQFGLVINGHFSFGFIQFSFQLVKLNAFSFDLVWPGSN